MGISVLLSIYSGTVAGDFAACLESIQQQALLPDQVVVVVDGPIDDSVDKELHSFEQCEKFAVDVLRFPENRGLGAALADGLDACRHELVARVDTDDISVPHRLETQKQHLVDFSDTSVVGGLLEEQYIDGERTLSLTRPVPLGVDIIRKSRYRNPLDHPTVMFRRSHVLNVGGYQPFPGFEDYYLWARLINQGHVIENLDTVLVTTLADDGYFVRRGGFRYVKHEMALARKFHQIGFHNTFQFIAFLSTRILVRLLPNSVRRWAYTRFLRRHSQQSAG